MNRFHEAETPQEVIAQAVGAGSACWQPKPSGVFESTEASAVVDDAVERLIEIGWYL